eukprot:1151688-Pelagomonas_calceolata.AAC.4
MHVCRAECAPCKLPLPFIAYLLPLDKQQQTMHQRLPHPHTRAGGAGPAPHCISGLCAIFSSLTSQLAAHIIVNCEVHGMGTPAPQTHQGHPQMYAGKICTDRSPSGGLRWPGWESQNQNLESALKTRSLHPRSPKLGCPDKKVLLGKLAEFQGSAVDGLAGSGQELPATGCQAVLLGRVAKLPEGGVDMGGPRQPGVNFTGRSQT